MNQPYKLKIDCFHRAFTGGGLFIDRTRVCQPRKTHPLLLVGFELFDPLQQRFILFTKLVEVLSEIGQLLLFGLG